MGAEHQPAGQRRFRRTASVLGLLSLGLSACSPVSRAFNNPLDPPNQSPAQTSTYTFDASVVQVNSATPATPVVYAPNSFASLGYTPGGPPYVANLFLELPASYLNGFDLSKVQRVDLYLLGGAFTGSNQYTIAKVTGNWTAFSSITWANQPTTSGSTPGYPDDVPGSYSLAYDVFPGADSFSPGSPVRLELSFNGAYLGASSASFNTRVQVTVTYGP